MFQFKNLVKLIGALTFTSYISSANAVINYDDPETPFGGDEFSNSGYFEIIDFNVNPFVPADYISHTPSNRSFPTRRENTFLNQAGAAISIAEVNSNRVPYVQTSAKSGISPYDDIIYAEASMGYKLDIYGLANSIVPVNYSSTFKINSIFAVGVKPESDSSVYFSVIELFNPAQDIVEKDIRCNTTVGTCNSYNAEFDSQEPTDSFNMTHDTMHTAFEYTDTINGTVYAKLDETGFGAVLTHIRSYSVIDTNSAGITNAYIDPFFSIDESYLALDPTARILLPSDVGNDNPLDAIAAVPEPETYSMLISGLALIGFASRRRKV